MKQQSIDDFVYYVSNFYGSGGIYDMNATDEQIFEATQKYLKSGADFCGDSIDRENVRDILIRDYGLIFPRR